MPKATKEKERFERIYCNEIKQYFNSLKAKIIKEWGNKSLYDNEVSDIGKQLLGKKYIGTFPIDLVPLSSSDKYMIANVDRAGESGSHWVAIHIKGNTIYVYDSFARKSKTLLKPLYEKAKKMKKKIVDVNAKSDQRSHSQVCGPISLSWLYIVFKYGIKAGECI